MEKTEGTYIRVAYKNVFGHISTNVWPFLMIQKPTIREKCAWVSSNTWLDERPVFFRFFDFSTNILTGNWKISEFVQRQPVVWSFAVGFSSISVFFPAQQTGPANTTCLNSPHSWHHGLAYHFMDCIICSFLSFDMFHSGFDFQVCCSINFMNILLWMDT